MIYDAQIETRDMGDKRVLDYLAAQCFRNCIDLGGVQRPWASKFVTTYVDLVEPIEWVKRYPDMYDAHPKIWTSAILQGDCEDDEIWFKLMQVVVECGLFDFVICTHMAEHLSNPKKFFERLPMLAKEGFIGVPNQAFEMGRGREFSEDALETLGLACSYRGAFPHRWIYTIDKEGKLIGLPKLGGIEVMDFGKMEKEWKHYEPLEWGQLGFFWMDEIPTRIINDSDIGFPHPQTAIDLYRKILGEGL